MSTKVILASILGLIIIGLMSFGGAFNGLQQKDELINNKWSQIETQLQRRMDLIPNLVKVVKAYATHEKTVFTNIAEARSKLSGALQTKNPAAVSAANNSYQSALSRLLVVAENYPQLKANEGYNRLTDELAGTENRIAVSRKDYNDAVTGLNTMIRQFPNNILAGFAGVAKREYFKAPESAAKAPEVNIE
jgi:LemA protein